MRRGFTPASHVQKSYTIIKITNTQKYITIGCVTYRVIEGNAISETEAAKIAEESITEFFGNRAELKRQFLIIDKELSALQIKLGETLANTEVLIQFAIYLKSGKAVLEWTAGDKRFDNWRIVPYQTKNVAINLPFQFINFNLYRYLQVKGVV